VCSETPAVAQFSLFKTGVYQCNTVIATDPAAQACFVIDPGGDADSLLKKVAATGFPLTAIYITHAHFDHILAAETLREATGAKVYLQHNDVFLWKMVYEQCRLFNVPPPPQASFAATDASFEHDQPLLAGGKVLRTPGHTPGSVCFYFAGVGAEQLWIEDKGLGFTNLKADAGLLVSGDTLFRRGVGRTDLWQGDSTQLGKSIKQRLYTLPADPWVLPGHGLMTTLEQERQHNPYVLHCS
jgi:glyoxylase-like metal-dependent hydrolase (beta-lactamase superfamily II)